MPKNSKTPGLKLRGTVYYIRVRVPVAYADIEPRKEVFRSLDTSDPVVAQAKCANARLALRLEWDAARAAEKADVRAVFDSSTELLRSWGMTFSPMKDLLHGEIDQLLERIEKIANIDPSCATVPALLGAVDLPDHTLSEMAERMPELKKAEIRAKNARQRREWCGNFTRAAKDFAAEIGERTIMTISEQDATNYWEFWKKRAREDVTPNYANKQIRYVRQMIAAHFEDIRMPVSKRVNPFKGMSVSKNAYDSADNERSKLSLPEKWIRNRLVGGRILEPFNQEASDIAIVAAVCGCRASEIYDLPAEDIHLDDPIPHLSVRVVLEGPDVREIKGASSKRDIVLLGPALDAMRRHPKGFPRYRGKASYSGNVNNFLRENRLFPELPADSEGKFVISGTRHSFEDRMKVAKILNEERAFMMGHSIGKVRGRPVYGSKLALPLRALYQEMITFPTESWVPRPRAFLRKEIDRLLEEQGHLLE
ncbi:integrase [Marivita lacus]|uniref:Integrase n=1 Tax=Marivita lacus TaxID=1323742 RepID=A0ABQ1KAM5_9RHOB|nr:DUF6538 domain-containing protein [Marivita lacus]GGB93865.1 integrase [Marivita lacus]